MVQPDRSIPTGEEVAAARALIDEVHQTME
jgi:hypothetical protein